MSPEKQKCCHDACDVEMPSDESKTPSGWTVARIEEYGKKTVRSYYVYLCPLHKISSETKQADLFAEAAT